MKKKNYLRNGFISSPLVSYFHYTYKNLNEVPNKKCFIFMCTLYLIFFNSLFNLIQFQTISFEYFKTILFMYPTQIGLKIRH